MPQLCRGCLKVNEYTKPIFEDDREQLVLMIKECVSIEVTLNDNLPKKLCYHCLAQLSIAYKFRQLFRQSDTILQESIKRQQAFNKKSENLNERRNENGKRCNDEPMSVDNITIQQLFSSNIDDSINDVDISLNHVEESSENNANDSADDMDNSTNNMKEITLTVFNQSNAIKDEPELPKLVPIERKQTNSKMNFTTDPTSMTCNECQLDFKYKLTYDNHMLTHHNPKVDDIRKYTNKIGTKSHIKVARRSRVIEGGYEYSTKQVVGQFRYVRCMCYKEPICCPATAKISEDGKFHHVNPKHNHPRPENAVEILNFKSALQKLASTTDLRPREVYDAVAVSYPLGSAIVSFNSIRESLNRWGKHVAIPRNITEKL